MVEPKSYAQSTPVGDQSTFFDGKSTLDPPVSLGILTIACAPVVKSARKSLDPVEQWLHRAAANNPPAIIPCSRQSQQIRSIQLTKDQALIVLGMSSRARTRVADLERKFVLDCFRASRRRVEEEREGLCSFGYVCSEELERRTRELEWEECLVHAAAQHLLNAHRAEELSRHFSWKPGVPASREESRWKVLVKPKGRSVSILSKCLAGRMPREDGMVDYECNGVATSDNKRVDSTLD